MVDVIVCAAIIQLRFFTGLVALISIIFCFVLFVAQDFTKLFV
jgi:hypothetical protein